MQTDPEAPSVPNGDSVLNSSINKSIKKRLNGSKVVKSRARSIHMRSTYSENKKKEENKNELPRETVLEILEDVKGLSGHKALALIINLTKKAKTKQKSNILVN